MNQKKMFKFFSVVFFVLLFIVNSCNQKQEPELSWEDARLKFVREIGRMNLSQIPGIVLTDEERNDWLRMHEFIPTAEEMSDSAFFQTLKLEQMPTVNDAVVEGDFKTARLELKEYFQKKPVQKQLLELYFERGIDSSQVIDKAQQSFKERNFEKKDRYYKAFTTWGMMWNLLCAVSLTDNQDYIDGWFRIFNFFYHDIRPPAETPDVYVSVNGTANPWSTLTAAGHFGQLIAMKQTIDENNNISVNPEDYLNLCKSIFEHQDLLSRMNYRFYNSNWQIHQMTVLLRSTLVCPEFKTSSMMAQRAWQSLLCHKEN